MGGKTRQAPLCLPCHGLPEAAFPVGAAVGEGYVAVEPFGG